MFTINTILKEINDLPADRLDEVYEFVHSLNTHTKQKENLRKKILSFSGAFNDMPQKEYAEFIKQTKKVRTKLFDREINL